MADVHEAQGIKLFGTTISVQDTQPKDDHDPIISKKDDHNQPIEEEEEEDQKRPEKIIPCPRCKSMETKFCYFNNYNVNQPRHFCKGCQRYWTAGGALRNVPVGAGRRRNKPPCQGFAGLSTTESCFFDGSGVEEGIEFDGVAGVEEWRLAAERGGFHRVFPAKRRRSGGQSC